MKKLLAILALAGFTSAFAQSSVQLFGNIDQTFYRGTYGGNGIATTSSNAGSTSYWGIKGTDNLGGGTTAGFELRSELNLNTGQTGSATTGISSTDSRVSEVFNRAAFVELKNSQFGSIQAGRQASAWFEMISAYNNTGLTSFGWANATGAASGATAQHLLYNGTDLSASGKALNYMGASTNNPAYTGASEAFIGGISYTTPTVAGFTAKIQHGAIDNAYTTLKAANNMTAGSLTYQNGDLKVGYSTDIRNDSNGNTAFTQTALGVTYKLNDYNLVAARNYTKFDGLAKSQGGHDITITGLGVGKDVGRWNYNVGYTTMTDDDNSANKFTQVAAVARYNFSKNTSWYVGAGQGKNSGASRLGPVWAASSAVIPAAGDTGKTVNAFLTGVRYQF